MDDEGVLSRRARPAWGLIGLIGSILTATALVMAAGRTVAVQAAEDVVAPVERKIDDHLAAMGARAELMKTYVEEQRSMNRAVGAKLDALCRANPAAQCPLGSP